MTRRPPAALLLALLVAGPLAAQEPKLPDAKAFDKLVVDALRDVHNRGADLYNTRKDYEAAFRMYQGGLVAVRPLLGHRPAAQKLIDDGLAAADKEPVPALKAFKLHEAIEGVRTYLKNPDAAKKTPDPKPKDPKDDKDKPKDDKDKPKDKEKPDPKGNAAAAAVSGVVTLRGQPLAGGEVVLVTLDEKLPRVFTAALQADGSYSFKDALPAGRYAALVTGPAVPPKYHTTTTSGLTVEVKAGSNMHNLDLM